MCALSVFLLSIMDVICACVCVCVCVHVCFAVTLFSTVQMTRKTSGRKWKANREVNEKKATNFPLEDSRCYLKKKKKCERFRVYVNVSLFNSISFFFFKCCFSHTQQQRKDTICHPYASTHLKKKKKRKGDFADTRPPCFFFLSGERPSIVFWRFFNMLYTLLPCALVVTVVMLI